MKERMHAVMYCYYWMYDGDRLKEDGNKRAEVDSLEPGNETGLDTDIHDVEDVDVETDFDVDDVEDPTEDAFEKRELGEEGVFDVEEDGLDVHDKLEQDIDELVDGASAGADSARGGRLGAGGVDGSDRDVEGDYDFLEVGREVERLGVDIAFSNVEDGEVDLGDDGINPNPQVGNDRVERLEGSRSAAAQTRRTLVAESSSDGGGVPRSIGDDDAKVDVEVALATRRSGEGAPVGVEPAEGDVDGADDFEIERGGGGGQGKQGTEEEGGSDHGKGVWGVGVGEEGDALKNSEWTEMKRGKERSERLGERIQANTPFIFKLDQRTSAAEALEPLLIAALTGSSPLVRRPRVTTVHRDVCGSPKRVVSGVS